MTAPAVRPRRNGPPPRRYYELAGSQCKERYDVGRARWERNMVVMYGEVPSEGQQLDAYLSVCRDAEAHRQAIAGITLVPDGRGRWFPDRRRASRLGHRRRVTRPAWERRRG